jgi:hypothetical protein
MTKLIYQGRKIVVHDKMQSGYCYELTQPTGKNFAPEFKPELTPKQMLQLGIFGGKYLTDCKDEFPRDWFLKARLNSEYPDPTLNYFAVNASQTLSVWKQKGWIHPDDPRGWFQWYCRYYLGRRHPDDQRQINRWKAMQRHVAQLKIHCSKQNSLCRKKQRQALLHWAYDSRKI